MSLEVASTGPIRITLKFSISPIFMWKFRWVDS